MMSSVITDRVSGSVAAGEVATTGKGIHSAENVAGTNTITADLSPPAPLGGYYDNMVVAVRPVNNCTGAMKVNYDAIGEVDLVKPDGTAIGTGEVVTTQEYLTKYNGTHFRILAPF